MQPTLSPIIADTPFRLHASPGEAVAHSGWRQARAAVLAALGRGEAVALLGRPGTGKTMLLQGLAQTLRHEGWSVRLVDRGDALHPGWKADVLLVDEAGRMDTDALARLCDAGIPFVLAALPGLAERLAGLPRSVTPVALEPLPPEEVARFVAARLSAAGRPGDLLEPDAVLALAQRSGGLLRLVNLLAGTAVFLAELEHAPCVLRRHVDEAASLRNGAYEDAAPAISVAPAAPVEVTPLRAEARPVPPVPVPGRRPRRVLLGAAAAGLCLALAGAWAVSGRPNVPAPSAPTNSAGHEAETPRAAAIDPPPEARLEKRAGNVERPGEETLPPRQETEPPPRPTEPAAGPRPGAATNPRPRPSAPDLSAAFRGAVYNETLQQGGRMFLGIKLWGPAGAVTVRFEAWGGLLGSGVLTGTLSDDGRLSASGQLAVGRNTFHCDLSGLVADDRLTGSATFVRDGGGSVTRSTFALPRL